LRHANPSIVVPGCLFVNRIEEAWLYEHLGSKSS